MTTTSNVFDRIVESNTALWEALDESLPLEQRRAALERALGTDSKPQHRTLDLRFTVVTRGIRGETFTVRRRILADADRAYARAIIAGARNEAAHAASCHADFLSYDGYTEISR